jgi:hypothetical protein
MAEAFKFSVANFVVGWIAGLFYLTALATLIPFGALLATSGFTHIPEYLHNVPISALILVGIAVAVLFVHYRSVAHTIASLGWMTFLPGLGGLLLLVFGKVQIFAWLERFFAGTALEPFIAAIYNAMPQVWLFVIGYVVLGYIFIHIAGKIDREHALAAQLRKLFGPRARIYRSH